MDLQYTFCHLSKRAIIIYYSLKVFVFDSVELYKRTLSNKYALFKPAFVKEKIF